MLRWLLEPNILARLLLVALGFVIIQVIVRFVQRLLSRSIADVHARYRARKAAAFMGYLAALLLVVVIFSRRLAGLKLSVGIIGAGVAFALQEVITSVAGYVAVSVSNFYSPGDRVQLGGIKGDVIDIGILRTTLMEVGEWVKADQYTGRIVRIANSFVFKQPVFNYSADFPFLWDEITLPISHDSDQAQVRHIFLRVASEVVGDYAGVADLSWKEMLRKYHIEHARIEPMVTVVPTDQWLEFSLRYVVDYRARRTTRDQLYTRILEETGRTGGRVRLGAPSTDVNLTKVAPL